MRYQLLSALLTDVRDFVGNVANVLPSGSWFVATKSSMRSSSAIDSLNAMHAAIGPTRSISRANARKPSDVGALSQVLIGPSSDSAKRVMDLIISIAALILLSPLFLILICVGMFSIGAPIFHAHPRIGRNGRVFNCYKFRSMVTNGDEILAAHLADNPVAAEEWRQTRKLMNDPRVPAYGNLLRKSSLDELPQLFNVLRGDMSCVGPRPIVSAEIERYGVHARDYIKARPGITGLWQVSGRSRLSYSRRVALDVFYVNKRTIWLDLRIMLRTIPAVMDHRDTA